MQENENHTDNHSFKRDWENFEGIPDLFFSWGPGGSFRPTLLTILLMIVPLMIFKDKIIFGMRYLVDLIGR